MGASTDIAYRYSSWAPRPISLTARAPPVSTDIAYRTRTPRLHVQNGRAQGRGGKGGDVGWEVLAQGRDDAQAECQLVGPRRLEVTG